MGFLRIIVFGFSFKLLTCVQRFRRRACGDYLGPSLRRLGWFWKTLISPVQRWAKIISEWTRALLFITHESPVALWVSLTEEAGLYLLHPQNPDRQVLQESSCECAPIQKTFWSITRVRGQPGCQVAEGRSCLTWRCQLPSSWCILRHPFCGSEAVRFSALLSSPGRS